MLWKPDPANWLSWRRTLDGWGYSPLDQIDRTNVSRIRMVWARGLGTGTVEATPLVYDGVMYVPGPGDVIAAINAKSGDLIWEHRRKLPEGVNGGTNRNIAMWGSTLIDGSADNQIYAVDVHTGNMVWETAVMEAKKRARSSAGPIIANGRVITGRQCQPDAGNDACIITAHDAATGKEVWRTRTIPLPREPGYETWGDVPMAERWHVGTWMVPSYDPETNRIFVGTSVTIPAPKFTLAGNNFTYLYHNSTLALDADTGKIVWHYQHIVDHWDLNHPFERLLVETAVSPDPKEVAWINPRVKPGERRKVVTGIPGKTGVVYTLDRATGEFLWARPTVMQIPNSQEVHAWESGLGVNIARSITRSAVADTFITPQALLEHWQGHRRLTRRVIDAFPDDKLFSFSLGSMRPFGGMALEMLSIALPMVRGIVDDKWDSSFSRETRPKSEILRLWDDSTAQINGTWATIPPGRFQETMKAFGQYEGRVHDLVLYAIDNEVHHRGQGYVYLRALGIEPPPFYERQ
jgi:uncharacterized damage-inducible protein DinB